MNIPQKLKKGDLWRSGVFKTINAIIDYLHSSQLVADNETIAIRRHPAGQVISATIAPAASPVASYEYDGNFEFKILWQEPKTKRIETRRAFVMTEDLTSRVESSDGTVTIDPPAVLPQVYDLGRLQVDCRWGDYIYLEIPVAHFGSAVTLQLNNATLAASNTLLQSSSSMYRYLIAFVEDGGNIIHLERGIPTITIASGSSASVEPPVPPPEPDPEPEPEPDPEPDPDPTPEGYIKLIWKSNQVLNVEFGMEFFAGQGNGDGTFNEGDLQERQYVSAKGLTAIGSASFGREYSNSDDLNVVWDIPPIPDYGEYNYGFAELRYLGETAELIGAGYTDDTGMDGLVSPLMVGIVIGERKSDHITVLASHRDVRYDPVYDQTGIFYYNITIAN